MGTFAQSVITGKHTGMNFLSRAALKGAISFGKAVVGGAPSRMIAGGIIGGAYAAATSDNYDSTNYITNILKGAGTGAAIGGLSRAITPKLSGGFAKPWLASKSPFKTIGRIGKTGRFGAKTALGALNFGLRHPYMTVGAIGGGMALSATGSQPVYLSNSGPQYGQQSNYNQRLMQSTQGLTFGLHAGRH